MKVHRIPEDEEGAVAEHFEVDLLSDEDVAPLSPRFLEYSRDLEGLPALNSFTARAFLKDVRRRFVVEDRIEQKTEMGSGQEATP